MNKKPPKPPAAAHHVINHPAVPKLVPKPTPNERVGLNTVVLGEAPNSGEVITIATYDAQDKCIDCGGARTEHKYECPAVERGQKAGVPIGRLLPGGGSIDLPMIDTPEKLQVMLDTGKLPTTCTTCGNVVGSGATCIVDGTVAP